jgi:hypothetical protein
VTEFSYGQWQKLALARGFINGLKSSALSTAFSVGAILRTAGRACAISPAGRWSSRAAPLARPVGVNDDLEPVYVPIYPSEGSSSVSAQFAVGAGVTIPLSKAYHARIEGRATTFGLEVVTGPTDFQGIVPPSETQYLTQFSILIGIDLVLEKKHGRRY